MAGRQSISDGRDLPSRVDRAAFSRRRFATRARNASFTFFSSAQDSDRMSTSICTRAGMELIDVPPFTTPTLNVVFGFAGT
jgi:hypothetical protein